MKASTHDWLDNLSPERREEIEHIAAKAERESDEHMQRVCSSFGYKHGNYWAMISWITLTLFIAALGAMAFAFLAPVQEMTFETRASILVGIASLPPLIISALLFVFLKARYAFRVLGVLIAVIIVGQLLFRMLDPLILAVINLLLGA